MADLEFEDAGPRKKLAQLLLERNDFSGAVRFGKLALEIDVMDAEVHQVLGTAYAGLKQSAKAISEFETAIELNAEDESSVLAVAKLQIEAKRPADAKRILDQYLEQNPDADSVKDLRKSLK